MTNSTLAARLAEAMEADDTEKPAETPVESPEAPAEETEAEVPAEEPEPAEAATALPEEPVAQEERLWAGKYKTPEDMELGLRELQSYKDREIAEIKAKLEAYESLMNSVPEPEPQVIDITAEQLEAGVEQAPIDTFQWIMQNRPDLTPNVIGLVRDKHGNVTADQMQATFNNALMMAQQQAMQEQYQQMFEQTMGPQIMQDSFAQAINAVEQKYEEFDDLREETAQVLQQIGELDSYDPDTVALAVEYAFLQAYRQHAQAAPAQAPAPSPQEFVETGRPGQGVGPVSRDEKLRNEVADAFSKMIL